MSRHIMVQTVETFYASQWGEVTQVKVYTSDYKRLSWLQVWQAFTDVYPDRWAMELYPPANELINDEYVYHLWLLPDGWEPPGLMNLAARYR